MILRYMIPFLFALSTHAQCVENNETKTILIGDSWAFFMGVDETLNNVYERWGHSNISSYTNTVLAENGAKTIDFLEPDKQQAIIEAFNDFPEAEFVHLSIGGNDFLGNWKVSFTQQEIEDLKEEVTTNLLEVIDFIKGVKPGVHIVWSGYVYTNFDEVISNFWSPSNHPFYSTWEGMEYPTNEQINEQTVSFLDDIQQIFDQDPDVTFINAPGLMQFAYGQEDALEVSPFGTYQPGEAPLPYGYTDYPSPQNSMRDYGITKDCFHLSAGGYREMISYQTKKFYHKALMNDTFLLALDNGSSGHVSSNNVTGSDLLVGNTNAEDFATILTFNTTGLIDTAVTQARLFLRRNIQNGGNPISDSLMVSIRAGGFSGDLIIGPADFSASGDANGTPCLFGTNTGQHWVRLDLPQNMLPFITNNEQVQVRISAPNTIESLISFYDASDPEFAPVLDIVYGDSTSLNTHDLQMSSEALSLYPNPVESTMTIVSSSSPIKYVQVYDVLGKKVFTLRANGDEQKIAFDLQTLKAGTYIVQVKTQNNVYKKKCVKQ